MHYYTIKNVSTTTFMQLAMRANFNLKHDNIEWLNSILHDILIEDIKFMFP